MANTAKGQIFVLGLSIGNVDASGVRGCGLRADSLSHALAWCKLEVSSRNHDASAAKQARLPDLGTDI